MLTPLDKAILWFLAGPLRLSNGVDKAFVNRKSQIVNRKSIIKTPKGNPHEDHHRDSRKRQAEQGLGERSGDRQLERREKARCRVLRRLPL
jgi:hypothetical protein